MKVNLYQAVWVQAEPREAGEMKKGDLLATADLEVVPGGTYVIDGKPTFYIKKLPAIYVLENRSHHLKEVDLLVQPLEQ